VVYPCGIATDNLPSSLIEHNVDQTLAFQSYEFGTPAIQVNLPPTSTVRIFDGIGREVSEYHFDRESVMIPISNLMRGVYAIEIESAIKKSYSTFLIY
jgi:hypothetical protein